MLACDLNRGHGSARQATPSAEMQKFKQNKQSKYQKQKYVFSRSVNVKSGNERFNKRADNMSKKDK